MKTDQNLPVPQRGHSPLPGVELDPKLKTAVSGRVSQWFVARRDDVKSFFKEVRRPALIIAILLAGLLVASQPSDFIDKSWPRFAVLQRSILWFLRSTAVRSIVGPLALFIGYGIIYWVSVRGRQFIVVSDFRIW